MCPLNEKEKDLINTQLDQLARFLSDPDNTSVHLWLILSGLRGPDATNYSDENVKVQITEPIRRALMGRRDFMGNANISTYPHIQLIPSGFDSQPHHFREHAIFAIVGLLELNRITISREARIKLGLDYDSKDLDEMTMDYAEAMVYWNKRWAEERKDEQNQ